MESLAYNLAFILAFAAGTAFTLLLIALVVACWVDLFRHIKE